MRARSGLGVLNALGTQAFHMDNRAEALLKEGNYSAYEGNFMER